MTVTPLDTLSFDSDAHAPDERFGRYRSLYASGANAVALGDAVSGSVRAWRLDRAVIFDRRVAGIGHERDERRVVETGFDHFTLTLLLAGRFEVDAGAGFVPLQPGSAVLLDMTRPMRNRMWHAHAVTVSIARDRLAAFAGDVARLHGTVIGRAQAALLTDFLTALLIRLDTLSGGAARRVTTALLALLGVALGSDEVDHPKPAAVTLARRMAQLRELIAARIGDPAFGPEELVASSGVSRATLYRLLAPYGGVAEYLQARRLDRVRLALSNPLEQRSFAEIALDSGFKSESHCSTLFQRRFRSRPGEYRRQVSFAPDPDDPRLALLAWQQELR